MGPILAQAAIALCKTSVQEAARATIVCVCALALILAKPLLPF